MGLKQTLDEMRRQAFEEEAEAERAKQEQEEEAVAWEKSIVDLQEDGEIDPEDLDDETYDSTSSQIIVDEDDMDPEDLDDEEFD